MGLSPCLVVRPLWFTISLNFTEIDDNYNKESQMFFLSWQVTVTTPRKRSTACWGPTSRTGLGRLVEQIQGDWNLGGCQPFPIRYMARTIMFEMGEENKWRDDHADIELVETSDGGFLLRKKLGAPADAGQSLLQALAFT